VNDDDVPQGTQKHFSPPQQTLVLNHGNEKEVHAPSVGSNILRIRACKLLNV